MKSIAVLVSFLIVVPSIHAMPVAPEPVETIPQKGNRFKIECARHAKAELAKKQEHTDRFTLRYHELEEEEIKALVQAEMMRLLKIQIKKSLKTIFPDAPRLRRSQELNNFLEREADRYLKEAEEEQAVRAAKKCWFFSRCCR